MKKLSAALLMKNVLVGACIGITVGVCIEMIISFLVGSTVTVTSTFMAQFVRTQDANLIARCTYALLGSASSLWAFFVYSSPTDSPQQKPRLFNRTIVHLFGQAAMVMFAGLFLKWFNLSSLASMGMVLAIFLVVYAIIWLISYAKVAYETRQLNMQLKQLEETH